MTPSFGADHADTSPQSYVAMQRPIMVCSCSRLGRTANPPSFSLPDWLLPGRRRLSGEDNWSR